MRCCKTDFQTYVLVKLKMKIQNFALNFNSVSGPILFRDPAYEKKVYYRWGGGGGHDPTTWVIKLSPRLGPQRPGLLCWTDLSGVTGGGPIRVLLVHCGRWG